MRNKFFSVLILAITITMVVGCNSSSLSEQGPVHFVGDSPIVETVNGVTISQVLLDAFARGQKINLSDSDAREKALKELGDYVLLAQEAKRAQYDTSTQFQAEVEVARLQAVASATAAQIEKQTPLSDEILKAEYDQQVARAGKYIYAFSQLLFTDEADALAASGDVVSGKPFSEVFDIWKKKAKQAKTYTQVRLSQLPGTMAKVMQELKPGDSTKVPVKTEFGWHVINLGSTTPFVPSSFDTVKEAVRRTMLEQALAQRIKSLREQAQIAVIGAPPTQPAPTSSVSTATPGSQVPAIVRRNRIKCE